jgi:hypothetical protein
MGKASMKATRVPMSEVVAELGVPSTWAKDDAAYERKIRERSPVKPTTPIENVVDMKVFVMDYMAFCQSFGRPRNLVEIHKSRLGRQTKTFMGSRRMWVWERSTWTVFVNNTKGICFEVPEGSTSKQAWTAWGSYKALMRGAS